MTRTEEEQRIWDMTNMITPGRPGSPTKAEVMALVHVYRGEAIPDDVTKAVLLTTNAVNRTDVEESLAAWDKTAKAQIPQTKKQEIGLSSALTDLTDSICLGAVGWIDTSKQKRVNLEIALRDEILKNIQ